MNTRIHCETNGSVSMLHIIGDLRNSLLEVKNLDYFLEYSVPLVVKRTFTPERRLFQCDYPEMLEICHQRNINVLWVYTLNSYDLKVLEEQNISTIGSYDVLHFTNKKDACLYKLICS
jgi:hypothetical protein